jgi:cellulose synthase/poly-beta-1,6-N-acetylglucosamine synthase-like glycosyltransferase
MAGHENLYILVIFGIFLLSAVIQLFYYLFYYTAIWFYKPSEPDNNKPPVSVIICARNEGENLRRFLPSILEQDYQDYEVIVVNDCSEDNSYLILGNYLLQYPHLRISTVNKDPKFTHNKKFAQFIGIKAARNEILLFTDADCQPESDQWLGNMTSHFNDKTDFVLGYGGYMQKKGLLNKYIRYDSFTIAIQYLGMAIRGLPYMGVGRNLSYRRSLFFANNGYGAHNHLISGDDDLFVNSHANGRNTSVEFRKESHTRSVPFSGLKDWIIQKKRHLTTAPYYRLRDKILLVAESASRVLLYSAFIVLLCLKFNWIWIVPVLGLRLIVQFIVFILAGKKLNESGLLPFLIFFDIFSPVINGLLFISNTGSKSGKNRWR